MVWRRIDAKSAGLHPEKLPGGTAFSFIIDTGVKGIKLIHTPSMRIPSLIKDPTIVYHCTRSALLKENGGCMFFGEITVKLHNAIVSDPKPYRRDVKIMLANLLNLINDLEMEDFIIDRPDFSQRVRLNMGE